MSGASGVLLAGLLKQAAPDAPGEGPLVAEPAANGLDLLALVQRYRDEVLAELERVGAILFRGFVVGGVEWMDRFAEACARRDVMEYRERSSPRTAVGRAVYTSTEYPAREEILLHNENSYAAVWPERLCFFCVDPGAAGGETVLADTRRVLQSIGAETRAEFEARGVLYTRTLGGGLGVDWRTAFQCESREEVERACAEHGYEVQWLADGRLRTRRRGRAVLAHPRTGERSWFNHAMFFHLSSLERGLREALTALLPEEELPANAYYGDGAPIGDATITEVRRAYEHHATLVRWRAGDLLLVDNVICAHGRKPFRGARKLLVAMCDSNGETHA